MNEALRMVLATVIDGAIFGATLFLVAVGLTLIYGVLRILNITHGSFYAIGALVAASLWGAISQLGASPYLIYPAMLLSSLLVGVALGPPLERFMLRWMASVEPLARRENVQLLATYAIFLMLENVQRLIWGTHPYYSAGAMQTVGTTQIGSLTYTNYQLLLLPLAAIVLLALRSFLNKTITGKFIVSVSTDPEMSQCMGINVDRIQTIAFTIGIVLASLGGALASPSINVSSGIGADTLVLSFAVVAVAGLGEIEGSALAAFVIGLAHSSAVFFYPELSAVMPYIIMLLVIMFKPYGLFGKQSERRI